MKHEQLLTDYIDNLPDGNINESRTIDLDDSVIVIHVETSHQCRPFRGSYDEEPEMDCSGYKRITSAVEYDEDEKVIWRADRKELEQLNIEY